MAKTRPFEASDMSYLFGISDEVKKKITEALENGCRVERRESEFKDPGDDWAEILVDGEVLEGTRTKGY